MTDFIINGEKVLSFVFNFDKNKGYKITGGTAVLASGKIIPIGNFQFVGEFTP